MKTATCCWSWASSGSRDGQFWLPTGIAIANDVMYVPDSANQRIEVFHYLKDVR